MTSRIKYNNFLTSPLNILILLVKKTISTSQRIIVIITLKRIVFLFRNQVIFPRL